MVNINKKFLTLVLTAGLIFATASIALADTVPLAQIMSQPDYSYGYDRIRELNSQCPVGYYVYEVYDNNDNTGEAVSVGQYQWIGSDMTKGTVKIADANGNRVHAIITPAQYAAGQYPGGTSKVTTPAPTPVSKPTPALAPKPTLAPNPTPTIPSATATNTDGTPVVNPTQVATAEVAQTPEQIVVAQAELKVKMDEAKISIGAYRQQLGIDGTVTTPDKKVGIWKRFILWVSSLFAKTK